MTLEKAENTCLIPEDYTRNIKCVKQSAVIGTAKVVQQESKKCPIDNEKLTMSKLHPDNYAQREIQNLTVVCRNKEA